MCVRWYPRKTQYPTQLLLQVTLLDVQVLQLLLLLLQDFLKFTVSLLKLIVGSSKSLHLLVLGLVVSEEGSKLLHLPLSSVLLPLDCLLGNRRILSLNFSA